MCSPALPLVLCQSSTFSQLDRERLASSFATRPDDSQEQIRVIQFHRPRRARRPRRRARFAGHHGPVRGPSRDDPRHLAGRDVCGRAPTGSGKTLAFGIPLVARVGKAKPRQPRALVLAPDARARCADPAGSSHRWPRCGAAPCSPSTAASATSRSAGRCAAASTSSSPVPAVCTTSSSRTCCASTRSRRS